jgi:hypothetical protein
MRYAFNFVSLWNATSQIKSSQTRMILDVLVWWPWMLTMTTDAQHSKVTVNASSKDSYEVDTARTPTLFG